MTDLTIIQMSRDELSALIRQAMRELLEASKSEEGTEWGVNDMARYLGISTRTVRNREKAGELPPREGRYWRKDEVTRWYLERQQHEPSVHKGRKVRTPKINEKGKQE